MKSIFKKRSFIFAAVGITSVILFFQNCSPQFQTMDMGSLSTPSVLGSNEVVPDMGVPTETGGLTNSPDTQTNNNTANVSGQASAQTPARLGTGAAGSAVLVYDATIGNGSTLKYKAHLVSGAGTNNLRGCWGLVSQSGSICKNESEYSLLRLAPGWTYDGNNDRYVLGVDVSSQNLAHGPSFLRLIMPNGSKLEMTANPIRFVDSSTAGAGVVQQLRQNFSGMGKHGVMACSQPASTLSNPASCGDASLYRNLQTDGWAYNANTDTISTDKNVAASGFPQQSYYTRFILGGGLRTQITWTPTATVVATGPKCQWSSGQAVAGPCSEVRTQCNENNQGQTAIINCAAPQNVVTTCRCQ